jgi:hypothetical protein
MQPFRLYFALFSYLFPHGRVAFPCFWVGTGGGNMVCSHLCSCVYTSLSGTVQGPIFPQSFVSPPRFAIWYLCGLCKGEAEWAKGVTIQRGLRLEGRQEQYRKPCLNSGKRHLYLFLLMAWGPAEDKSTLRTHSSQKEQNMWHVSNHWVEQNLSLWWGCECIQQGVFPQASLGLAVRETSC